MRSIGDWVIVSLVEDPADAIMAPESLEREVTARKATVRVESTKHEFLEGDRLLVHLIGAVRVRRITDPEKQAMEVWHAVHISNVILKEE
jgi:hypothetical protein